jgi:hypothetical protein
LNRGKHKGSFEFSFLPKNGRVGVLEEGVSQDKVITGDIGDEEYVSQGSSIMLDEESNGVGYLSGPVQGSVDILHLSWSCKLLGFYA